MESVPLREPEMAAVPVAGGVRVPEEEGEALHVGTPVALAAPVALEEPEGQPVSLPRGEALVVVEPVSV